MNPHPSPTPGPNLSRGPSPWLGTDQDYSGAFLEATRHHPRGSPGNPLVSPVAAPSELGAGLSPTLPSARFLDSRTIPGRGRARAIPYPPSNPPAGKVNSSPQIMWRLGDRGSVLPQAQPLPQSSLNATPQMGLHIMRAPTPAPVALAVLTMSVGRLVEPSMQPAVDSKRCYCALHGYDFILDTRSHTDALATNLPTSTNTQPGFFDPKKIRTAHWARVPAVRELLKTSKYEWVFYMDLDMMIVNWTIQLEMFVARAAPEIHLIFSDGDHVNSGAFFIRRSTTSIAFLAKWWGHETTNTNNFDQGPLSSLILDIANKARPGHYQQQCEDPRMADRRDQCWNEWMGKLGFPLNKRRIRHILFWPCHGFQTSLRGFNFYGHSAWLRHECQHYQPGDLLAHTHHTYEWDIGFKNDTCPSPWAAHEHVEVCVDPRPGLSADSPATTEFLAAFVAHFPQPVPLSLRPLGRASPGRANVVLFPRPRSLRGGHSVPAVPGPDGRRAGVADSRVDHPGI